MVCFQTTTVTADNRLSLHRKPASIIRLFAVWKGKSFWFMFFCQYLLNHWQKKKKKTHCACKSGGHMCTRTHTHVHIQMLQRLTHLPPMHIFANLETQFSFRDSQQSPPKVIIQIQTSGDYFIY